MAAQPPFRPVLPEVRRWLDRAAAQGSELVPLARELLVQIGDPSSWSVHGDFHHHNLLKHGDHYVATAAKIEGRIAAFTDAGLDDFRIRAWTVIRAVYLWPALGTQIAALI